SADSEHGDLPVQSDDECVREDGLPQRLLGAGDCVPPSSTRSPPASDASALFVQQRPALCHRRFWCFGSDWRSLPCFPVIPKSKVLLVFLAAFVIIDDGCTSAPSIVSVPIRFRCGVRPHADLVACCPRP
ncbi:unnamed protein product, partial [Phaeothamnion confervicola]